MTTILFVAFLVATVAIVIGAIARYLGGDAARRVAGALAAWLVVAGLLSYLGVVANTTMRPPGTALIAFPVVAFLVYFAARGSRSKRVVVRRGKTQEVINYHRRAVAELLRVIERPPHGAAKEMLRAIERIQRRRSPA